MKSECPECGRCGKTIDSRWDSHPSANGGDIQLGFPAQIFNPLAVGPPHVAGEREFKFWAEFGEPAKDHPIKKFDAQSVRLEWGDEDGYFLCYDCQKSLLRTIGKFFKFNNWEAQE